ncbi:MAG: GAF domain-containing protein, partial [Myxococcota bacterium]
MSDEKSIATRFWTPVLYDVAGALESIERPEERVDRVLDLLAGFVPYDRCALLEATPLLGREISVRPPLEEVEQFAGRLRRLLRLLSDEPLGSGVMEDAKTSRSAHLAVPVITLGEVQAILYVERVGEDYQEEHLAFLSVVAAQIAAYLATLKAHRELQASESRFRRLYESRMLGMVFMDAAGRVHDANEGFMSVAGRSLSELRSLGWFELLPAEEEQRNRKAARE